MRILLRDDRGPLRVKKDDIKGDLWLCRCGLSRSQPFCDGSHKHTRDETDGVLFRYDGDGEVLTREEVEVRLRPLIQEEAPAAPPATRHARSHHERGQETEPGEVNLPVPSRAASPQP